MRAGSSLGKDLEKVIVAFSQFIFVFSYPLVLSSETLGFYPVDVSLLKEAGDLLAPWE